MTCKGDVSRSVVRWKHLYKSQESERSPCNIKLKIALALIIIIVSVLFVLTFLIVFGGSESDDVCRFVLVSSNDI